MAEKVVTSKPPKTIDARPIGFLLLASAFLSGLLVPFLLRSYPEIQARVELVSSRGWAVDWVTGAGCFSSARCYEYVFTPLQKTPLAPLISSGYENLLTSALFIFLLPLFLGLSCLIFRKVQDALRGYELAFWLGGLLALGTGLALGYFLPSLPFLRDWGLFLGVLLLPIAFRIFPGPRLLTPYSARYATDSELKDMIERFPGPHSIPLAEKPDGKGVYVVRPGTSGRRELEHVLVVAPTRSGKGLHLQTLIYTWKGSLIVVDIKGEMHRRTSGHRREVGPVWVLDPTGDGHSYDPFADLETDEEINTAVKLILETGDPENKIFEDRASYAFLAMIAASKVRDEKGNNLLNPSWRSTLAGVVEMMAMGSTGLRNFLYRTEEEKKRGREETLAERLARDGNRWAAKAIYNMKQFYGDGGDVQFRESSWNILTSTMQALTTEGVAKMMSHSDFVAADLVENPSTLYLRFPESLLKATVPVLKLIEISLSSAMIRHIDRELRGFSPVPILWAYDEAKVAPVPELPEAVSTWAGRNMYALIYIQDLSQLEDAYGAPGAETIMANTVKVFYVGNPNIKTAEHVSQALGKYSQESASYTYSKEASESRSFVARELVAPEEFSQATYPGATPNDVFIFPRGRRPIRGKKLTPFGLIKPPPKDPVYPWREE